MSVLGLSTLADQVAPVSLAGERTLPVGEELSELFPERGLVRGRTFACRGQAATSLAMTLLAPSVTDGGWALFVDVPWIGIDAAAELGVCLERVAAVRPDVGRSDSRYGEEWAGAWVDVVAAAADGFDMIVTRVPEGVRSGAARSLSSRLRQRGAVMMLIGPERGVSIDGELTTRVVSWEGVGDGHGHLTNRTVEVSGSGRRLRQHAVRTSLLGRTTSLEMGNLAAVGDGESLAAGELMPIARAG